MKVNKSQGLLYIFNSLLQNGSITREDVTSELEISDLTFYRYIQEIRAFFYNFYPSYILELNRSNNRYQLIKN